MYIVASTIKWHLQEIQLVPTILQTFSFTLYKRDTCPLVQAFCASPKGVHLRELTVICVTPHLSL